MNILDFGRTQGERYGNTETKVENTSSLVDNNIYIFPERFVMYIISREFCWGELCPSLVSIYVHICIENRQQMSLYIVNKWRTWIHYRLETYFLPGGNFLFIYLAFL